MLTVQEVTPLPELEGRILGNAYRIESQIDEGGMGTVYQARHVRLGRPLAVKIMAPHLATQPGALARFSREAEIISQLSHPHVVQVLDFNTTEDGRPYLVMELLEGRPLNAVIEQHGQLHLDATLEIAIQSAHALTAAHDAGIVHRDLKPGNIFLLDTSDQLFIKLLDFGISKRRAAEASPHQGKLTGDFDILGTPEYMPPEQAVGKTAAVDHRGDQYALASIVYEMLAGRPPFVSNDVMELLQDVIRTEPTPPSAYRSDIPAAVDETLMRALSKSPEERFATIADFADALDAIRQDVYVRQPGFRRSHRPQLSTQETGTASAQRITRRQSRAPHGPPSTPEAEGGSASLEAPPPPPAVYGASETIRRSASPSPVSQPGSSTRPKSSWHAKDSLQSTKDLVVRARQELGLDNLELALSCAESALDIAQESKSNQARAIISENATLFSRIFQRKLGPLESRIQVSDHPYSSLDLSPEQAFLLSRIEDGMTLEEAIDLSPLPREFTLGHLAGLVRSGQIHIKR